MYVYVCVYIYIALSLYIYIYVYTYIYIYYIQDYINTVLARAVTFRSRVRTCSSDKASRQGCRPIKYSEARLHISPCTFVRSAKTASRATCLLNAQLGSASERAKGWEVVWEESGHVAQCYHDMLLARLVMGEGERANTSAGSRAQSDIAFDKHWNVCRSARCSSCSPRTPCEQPASSQPGRQQVMEAAMSHITKIDRLDADRTLEDISS